MEAPRDETLLQLYALGHAPVSPDSLLPELGELSVKDFRVSTVFDEVEFLTKFASTGLKLFKSRLSGVEDLEDPVDDGIADDADAQQSADPEVPIALYALSAYAKKLQTLAGALSELALSTLDRYGDFKMEDVKALEKAAQEGRRPKDRDLEEVVNLTLGTRWAAAEPPSKNRTVGFKEVAAVITEGKVQEEALKVGEYRRKKQRNPTGYHKFNFKDLGLADSDFDSEGQRSRASSLRGGSTDGGSTRGSISHGVGTSGSASSGGEEEYVEEAAASGTSNIAADPELNPFVKGGKRSTSSVLFSFNKEREIIEDKQADPQWEDQNRHERRYSRIRARVPTGHPSLMKSTSGELAGLVSEYEQQLSSAMSVDDQTADNTEHNKVCPAVPPEESKISELERSKLEKPSALRAGRDPGSKPRRAVVYDPKL